MAIPTELVRGVTISGLTNVNVIVGKNGAGKSQFLRQLNKGLSGFAGFRVSYISPERTGTFDFEPQIDTNIQNVAWLQSQRLKNQGDNFKQISESYLRRLESLFLQTMEKDRVTRLDLTKTFQSVYLEKLNAMLMNVRIVPHSDGRVGFAFENMNGDPVPSKELSSGESEAIALGTEVMYFFATLDRTVTNVLLLDEPDVHMHADLQARFGRFLIGEFLRTDCDPRESTLIVTATHSTPLICALAGSSMTSLGTKHFGLDVVEQRSANAGLRKSLPFFGHPLSLVINGDPLLIMEGEDDERVWSQAARSSQGRIRLFPCLSETVDKQTELETYCAELLTALYDQPVAYSVRDADGSGGGTLANVGPIKRFKLNCYAIENALVSDDCLTASGSSWPDFQSKGASWAAANTTHPAKDELLGLIGSTDRCQNKKLKLVRNVIPEILGTKKPWEVIIGRSIAALNGSPPATVPAHSLTAYLGIAFLTSIGVFTTTA